MFQGVVCWTLDTLLSEHFSKTSNGKVTLISSRVFRKKDGSLRDELIDQSGCFINCFIDCFIDCLIDCFTDCFIGCFISCLIGCFSIYTGGTSGN